MQSYSKPTAVNGKVVPTGSGGLQVAGSCTALAPAAHIA